MRLKGSPMTCKQVVEKDRTETMWFEEGSCTAMCGMEETAVGIGKHPIR